MKNLLSGTILSVLAFCVCVSAQSVLITPNRIVYHRPKPIDKMKRTFVVTYPKVKAANRALSARIEAAISFRKVLQLDVREELTDVQWLEEASYKVDYNARGILVITLSMYGTAAYPDGSSRTVAVDLRKGNRIAAAQAFTKLDELVELIGKKQELEIRTAIDKIKKDPDVGDEDPAALFADEKFSRDDLDQFVIDNGGVTFIHEYGFPHVIQALEPEGRYRYSWRAIAKFVNLSGPLAQFARHQQ